jgi:hypothetical protein
MRASHKFLIGLAILNMNELLLESALDDAQRNHAAAAVGPPAPGRIACRRR